MPTDDGLVDRAYEAFQDEYHRLNAQHRATEADEHDEYQREAMTAAVARVLDDVREAVGKL